MTSSIVIQRRGVVSRYKAGVDLLLIMADAAAACGDKYFLRVEE